MKAPVLAVAAVLLFPGVIAAQATAADPVTFTKDVAPILQRSCQVCHRDGSIAPMSLLTYEDARPWARAIKENVANRVMPPWYIDKRIGIQGFKADKSLWHTGDEPAPHADGEARGTNRAPRQQHREVRPAG